MRFWKLLFPEVKIQAKKFARNMVVKNVYTDLKTMLDTEKIDIVYLAIPNSCHFEYIMEILERGIPVHERKTNG